MFDPDRHEPCCQEAWNASEVEAAITNCLNQSRRFLESGHWRQQGEEVAATTIYEGAMGELWAVCHLADRLKQPLPFDVSALADEIFAAYPEFEGEAFKAMDVDTAMASYFLGHTGAFNVMQRLVPGRYLELQQKLIELATINIENKTLEVLWGGPGSIIPILNNLETQNPENSAALLPLFHRQFEFLKSQLELAEDYDCQFWTQDLYGAKRRLTGAGHGFVGNVYAYLRGQSLLPESDREWLLATVVDTLLKTVQVEGDLANWPSSLGGLDRGRPAFLVQWCHGAPGILLAVNDIPMGYSAELDQVLTKAGETIWQAGPLKKGLGLCHGTDGNGYALLKLFQRTGDEKWLNRARAFAMHGIGQYQERPGVWEGDGALALYLSACERSDARMPLWDYC